VSEVEVNLEEVHQQLIVIEQNVAMAKQKHNSFLSELGLPLLP
jgi:type I restriction enzyme M protein